VVYRAAFDSGLEGIIAKLKNSRYEYGKRSADWLKIKNMTSDDFVIDGFTAGTGNRAETFGALLLGRYDEAGKLVFVGHVGSGFDERLLIEIRSRLEGIKSDACPFAEVPPQNAPATWVRPELVAEVKYSQITEEGYLRTPVFLRLRDDKPVTDVRSVVAVSPVSAPSSAANGVPGNPVVTEIMSQLQRLVESLSLSVEEHKLSLTNLSKELWPATETRRALTKRDFITYLAQLSPYILPQLRDRPLTLTRFPHGISGEHFYQKHIDTATPEFVQKVALREHDGGLRDYLMCNDLATLLWLGQLADIELHTWFSRVSPEPGRLDLIDSIDPQELSRRMVEYPDFLIFDLDPYLYSGDEVSGGEPELNRAAFNKTCEAVTWLKAVLDGLGLESFVKTSGKTGLHVHVPIVRQFDYLAVRSAAETICKYVWQQHQQDITIDWAVEKRRGKVFLDYNQNVMGKTLASAYSPRPTPQATVSTPLQWNEIGKVYPTDFTILTMPERVSKVGDLWAGILTKKHDLSAIIRGK
jgi:bifunctional non-homologous end joining protein LigD